jgi:hypothetical protein
MVTDKSESDSINQVTAESTAKIDVGFVACIEGGVLEAQTLLLFESIRRYAGLLRDSALYALSPRAGHGISNNARRRLDDLGAYYSDRVLNTACPEYGSANRVAAAAFIEENHPHDILVILDSDTLFLREPIEFLLQPDVEAAVRPVDLKGISTSGPTDSFDWYWKSLCEICDVDYDSIPWRESFIDRERIKANYNAGLVVAQGRRGILRRWAEFFFKSIEKGLVPRTEVSAFRAGAGWVEPTVANFWGSNQAALSLAIWNTTTRVRELPPTYNYPLHQHHQIDTALRKKIFGNLVHVHYHWLFAKDALDANPLFLPSGPLSLEQRTWLRSATPIS